MNEVKDKELSNNEGNQENDPNEKSEVDVKHEDESVDSPTVTKKDIANEPVNAVASTSMDSVDSIKPSCSQNTNLSSDESETDTSLNNKNKRKRNNSKDEHRNFSKEKSPNISKKDISKRQKLNENNCNSSDNEDNNATNPKKHKSKTKKSEKKKGKTDKEDFSYLIKEKPKPDWCIIPEVINREIGNNSSFRRRFYGSQHAVERLELLHILGEHRGCVNTLQYNARGNLLVSGSDDLHLIIWDWSIGKKQTTLTAGHMQNIFQAKWLHFDNENLMTTCARDGQVRLIDIERDSSRRLASHQGAVYKLSLHPETPHVILSAGEDGKIFSIDIRENRSRKLMVALEEDRSMELYSIDINPVNCKEFCIGGLSTSVKIFDTRFVSRPLYTLNPQHIRSDNTNKHITCAVYNYDGTEILASYHDDDIYLFKTFKSIPYSESDAVHRYMGHANSTTVKNVNFFGPKSEYILSGSDCGNIFIWDKKTEAVVQWMRGSEQEGAVNVLEPHPHIPILATSGLEHDVKIWAPSARSPPAMKDLETCMSWNTQIVNLSNNSGPAIPMLQLLLGRFSRIFLNAANRNHNPFELDGIYYDDDDHDEDMNDGDDDDDEDEDDDDDYGNDDNDHDEAYNRHHNLDNDNDNHENGSDDDDDDNNRNMNRQIDASYIQYLVPRGLSHSGSTPIDWFQLLQSDEIITTSPSNSESSSSPNYSDDSNTRTNSRVSSRLSSTSKSSEDDKDDDNDSKSSQSDATTKSNESPIRENSEDAVCIDDDSDKNNQLSATESSSDSKIKSDNIDESDYN